MKKFLQLTEFKVSCCILLFSFANLILMAQVKDRIDTALIPFWGTPVMYNESVLMIKRDGQLPVSYLLYKPVKIFSVRNAALNIDYKEGTDWEYKDGTLRLLKGSKATYLADTQLYPVKSKNAFPRKGGGLILFSEGSFFHNQQLAVTYSHATDAWNGPVAGFQGTNLPGAMYKLKKRKLLNILLFGDSIAAGANASGENNSPPYLPGWGNLVADGLRRYYKGEIEFTNTSVGGKDSRWGLVNVEELVNAHDPDLVIIAFGMNDGTIGMDPDLYKANTQTMINKIREHNPKVEFILVATMMPNPESDFVGTQVFFKKELAGLTGRGIVIVDMTSVHSELLKYKSYQDMTGNNINHPNDFLIRWYAQQILSIFIP
ncbi:MAG: SGNH/GDSL hydrolase family protein [Ferruginibacter sp.]